MIIYSIVLFKDGLRRRNLPKLTLRKVLTPRNDGSGELLFYGSLIWLLHLVITESMDPRPPSLR